MGSSPDSLGAGVYNLQSRGPSRIGISYALLEILESQIFYRQKNSVYSCISQNIIFKSISFAMKSYLESQITWNLYQRFRIS